MSDIINMSFETAAQKVKNLKSSPADDELLSLYGLYKQSVVGDCGTDRPGMMYIKEKAKWDAWNGRKGLSKSDAEAEYVVIAEKMVAKYGMK